MQIACKNVEVQLALSVNGEQVGQPFDGQEFMKRYLDLYMQHGGLFGQKQAAGMVGVSPQRIDQLIKAGRLRVVSLSIKTPAGELVVDRAIPGSDLLAWLEAPKPRGGRGKRAVPLQVVAQAA